MPSIVLPGPKSIDYLQEKTLQNQAPWLIYIFLTIVAKLCYSRLKAQLQTQELVHELCVGARKSLLRHHHLQPVVQGTQDLFARLVHGFREGVDFF